MGNNGFLIIGIVIALGALSLVAEHPSDHITPQVVLHKIENVLVEYQTGNLEPTVAIRKISNFIQSYNQVEHKGKMIRTQSIAGVTNVPTGGSPRNPGAQPGVNPQISGSITAKRN